MDTLIAPIILLYFWCTNIIVADCKISINWVIDREEVGPEGKPQLPFYILYERPANCEWWIQVLICLPGAVVPSWLRSSPSKLRDLSQRVTLCTVLSLFFSFFLGEQISEKTITWLYQMYLVIFFFKYFKYKIYPLCSTYLLNKSLYLP